MSADSSPKLSTPWVAGRSNTRAAGVAVLAFAAPVDPYTIAGAVIIIRSGWLVLK